MNLCHSLHLIYIKVVTFHISETDLFYHRLTGNYKQTQMNAILFGCDSSGLSLCQGHYSVHSTVRHMSINRFAIINVHKSE